MYAVILQKFDCLKLHILIGTIRHVFVIYQIEISQTAERINLLRSPSGIYLILHLPRAGKRHFNEIYT